MKKKLLILVLTAFIINIVVTGFILMTVLSIQIPNITIEIKAVDLNDQTVTIETILFIKNPNSFSMTLDNIDINIKTLEGASIGTIELPNVTIAPAKNTTLRSTVSFGFNESKLTTFQSQITGNIGVTLLGFIQKTLPLRLLLITNPTIIVESVQIPSVRFFANFSEFTSEGLLFNSTVLIENNNDFSLYFSDFKILIDHATATNEVDFSTIDRYIPPKSMVPIYINGTAGYSLFNQGELSATLLGNVSVQIAGINLSVPISSSAVLPVPDISTFVFQDEHLTISISVDAKVTLLGLNMTVGVRFYNPTRIPLTAVDLSLLMYRVDNSTLTLLITDTLKLCPIQPENETCLKSSFLLPYRDLFLNKKIGFPDWFQLSLLGELSIEGTTQLIPVTINAYVSPKIF